MRPKLRLRIGGSESDITNEAATSVQKMRHVHEDLGRGRRASKGLKKSLQAVWRGRAKQKGWSAGEG